MDSDLRDSIQKAIANILKPSRAEIIALLSDIERIEHVALAMSIVRQEYFGDVETHLLSDKQLVELWGVARTILYLEQKLTAEDGDDADLHTGTVQRQ